MGFQVVGIPILGISRLLTWESQFWEFQYMGVALMVSHREYYKKEGGDFPQIQVVVNFVSSFMRVVHSCTKSAPIMH
jgi:hypothetical protein